jgi:transposase InsO family protein/transposase
MQHDYEAIRPLLFGDTTLSQRSEETAIPSSTLSDYARRFLEHGMDGLRDRRTTPTAGADHPFPDEVAAHILYLKQVYPPMAYREIVRIVQRKFGYHTNHHTVKRFLDRHAPPVQLALDFPTFHDFEDAYRARWTVVRLFYEGWSKQSIAGYLKLTRAHVYRILDAFAADGFAGLEDQRTRPATHPANQLSLPFFAEVNDLQQQYPDAGRFRIHGLLDKQYQDGERPEPPPSESTVGRAMAHNRAFRGAPDPLQDAPSDSAAADDPDARRYRAQERHQFWFVDVRYLVKLDGKWVYSICIVEGYSRKILAGFVSPYQDLVAILQVLHGALTTYGCPQGIVSDNGAVFRAHGYRRVLETLGITAHYIDKGRPWQNLIEAQFGVQRRLADAAFAQARNLEACQQADAAFVETFNTTAHWAHRERADGLRTPAAVLGQAIGQPVTEDLRQRAFRHFQATRTVNAEGFVSIQRFYVYAERGLARHRVAVWLYDDTLRVDYAQTLLAQYTVTYDRRRRRLRTVKKPVLHTTRYAAAQLALFELDDEQWHKVYSRPYERHAKRPVAAPQGTQLVLFPEVLAAEEEEAGDAAS